MEGFTSPHPIEVVWEGERRYRGGPPGGPTMVVDGNRKEAPSPVDALLVSMAACSAIDVVDILAKRRTPVSALSVRCDFSRAESPPRRLTDVLLTFTVTTQSDKEQVDRAVALSLEKYCSVASSLAPDTNISFAVEIPAAAVEKSA